RFSRDWSSDVCSSDLEKSSFSRNQLFWIFICSSGKCTTNPNGYFYNYFLVNVGTDAYFNAVLQKNNRSCFDFFALCFWRVNSIRSEERRVGKECRCGW